MKKLIVGVESDTVLLVDGKPEMCFESVFVEGWKEARRVIYLARSTGRHAGVLGGETWGPLPPERIAT
jgi:hypothetical protein